MSNASKYFYLIFCGLMMSINFLCAQNNIATRLSASDLPEYNRLYELTNNPVSFVLFPMQKQVNVTSSYTIGKSNDQTLYNPLNGFGYRCFKLKADGYSSQNKNRIVSGMASYINGVRLGTAWTDILDHALFYPYLVSDSIGGNYFSEAYQVQGMYGKRFGKILIGGQMMYRGEVDHRKTDPRPKNIISEIQFSSGFLLPIKKYSLGGYLRYVLHQQSLSTFVMESGRKDHFYSMNGFGLFNYQLSSLERNFERNFFDGSWRMGLHVSQNNNKGLQLSINTAFHRASERDWQERVPYQIKRLKTNAAMSYQWQITKRHTLQASILLDIHRSRGTEIHYDTVVLHRDPIIIGYEKSYSVMKHKMNNRRISSALLYQFRASDQTAYWAKIAAGTEGYREDYIYPKYSMSTLSAKGVIEIGANKAFRNSWGSISISYSNRRRMSGKLNSPPPTLAVRKFLHPLYDYLSANHHGFGIKMDWNRILSKKIALGLATHLDVTSNIKHRIDGGISISLILL